ncbi:hypothetical protein niasHS_010834 [Heterodera schachtii]|uniref:Uncharacterized protein n=1 Tax=Heterodera schachtii TaxID=97005 RepID=A0ABD2ISR6_HETSC
MSSSEVKPEDKSMDETSKNELRAEDTSIKDKETETNGAITTDNEPKIHAEKNETGDAAVGQKSTEEQLDKTDEKAEQQNVLDVNKTQQEPKAPPDEVKVTPQGDNSEQIPTETVVVDVVDTPKEANSENGKKESETAEKDQPSSQNSLGSDQKNEKTSPAQGGLPKWMVQNANAPPSPSPEVDGHKEQQQSSASPQKVRGRGRGRRPAAEKTAALNDKRVQSPTDDATSQRPRRSTRTRIDYANPDAVTVLAEVDDEEPSGTAKRQKGVRGPKPAQEKGLKRKTAGTSEDEVREEDEDDDLDYGTTKKKKKRVGTASPGKRGRPVGSKSKTMAKAKNVGRPKRGRNNEKESEDEDAEVVYDDRVSEKERTTDDEFEETKPSPNKAKTSVQAKVPAKKRGRPPGRRQGQQSPVDSGNTAKSETDEAKVKEEAGGNQQTINVEA